jgi:hypothetical protein
VRLKMHGQHLRDAFNRGVLQSDGPEILRTPSIFFFGKEDQVRVINQCEISAVVMKSREQV